MSCQEDLYCIAWPKVCGQVKNEATMHCRFGSGSGVHSHVAMFSSGSRLYVDYFERKHDEQAELHTLVLLRNTVQVCGRASVRPALQLVEVSD